MKKLLIIFLFCCLPLEAKDFDFQKVYEVSGKSAKDIEVAYDESEMVGAGAILLRRKYPTLQKAWDRYKTVWHLVNDEN